MSLFNQNNPNTKISKVFWVVLISFFIISAGAIAGSLTPSASPAGTMHTLSEIYDSIAGTFNSSGITSSTTGSLIQGIKALNSNLGWASGSNNIWSLNSGNVGIGTVSPDQKLDIKGNILASTSGTVDLTLNNTQQTYGKWIFRSMANPSDGRLDILNNATTLVSIASTGNVGIGTTAPTSKFYINYAGANPSNPIFRIDSTANATNPIDIYVNGGKMFQVDPYGAVLASSSLDVGGNVNGVYLADRSANRAIAHITTSGLYIGGLPSYGLSVDPIGVSNNNTSGEQGAIYALLSGATSTNATLKSYSIRADNTSTYVNNYGLYAQTTGAGTVNVAGYFSATGAGSNYGLIVANGNAGIGTTSPDAKLDINGNILASTSGNIDLTLNSTTCNDCKFTIRSVGSTTSARLSVLSSNSAELFTIASSGNVGIGTSSPKAKLDIPGFTPVSQLASVSGGSAPGTIYVQGRYAYIIKNAGNRFHIFDLSNPSAPASISSITLADTDSGVNNVYIQGSYAYVGENAHLDVIDISNPASPRSVGSLAGVTPRGVYVQGRYAYIVTGGNSTLLVVDVSNPSNPQLVSTTAIGSTSNAIYIQGRYAYVGRASGNLAVYNISNPLGPFLVGASTVASRKSIYVQGRWAFSTDDGSNRISITDVSNPAAPTFNNNTILISAPGWVIAQGRSVYSVGTTTGRFDVSDISNPAAPTAVGTLTFSSIPHGLAVQGRYAYITEGDSLIVVDVGGAYIQQLEAGGIEAGTLSLRNNLQINNDADIRGGAVIGRGLQVTGPVSITSSISGYTSWMYDPNGTLRLQAAGVNRFVVQANGAVLASGAAQFGSAGAPSSVSFSRFGTGTTAHRNISTPDDLLVSNDFEVLASATFNHIKVGSSASFDTWINIGQGAGLNIGTESQLVFLRSPTFIKLQTANGLGTYFGEGNTGNTMSATIVALDGNVNAAATTVFTIRDTAQTINSNTFAIRANTLTTGVVASISATSLTSSGLVEKWLVPASSSGGAGYLLIKDINNVTYASLGYGGRLSLARDIRSDGATSTCIGVNTPSQGCLDYAESFPTSEPVQAGDVVSADPILTASVRKAVSETGVIGIVSSNPAALIDGKSFQSGSNANETRANHAPIALAGRVPVKVTGENGIIGVGDRLTISKTKPGYAMKATEAGTTIGTSLESFSNISSNSEGSVLVFVNVGYWAPKLPEQATITIASNQSMFDAFIAYLKDIVLTVRGLVANKVDTQQLCIGQTCVNEDQLKVLLQGQNTITSTPEPSIMIDSPTPTPTISETPTPVPSVSEAPTPTPSIEVTASSSPSI